LAAVLSELATQPARLAAMKQRARAKALDFSMAKHVESYVTIYRGLLK
jgi:hypothetical protein